MPTVAVGERRPRLAGEILWLAITAGAGAVIVGIMCWCLSAELSAGAASSRPTAAVTPETSTGSAAVLPSPALEINRILARGAPSTTAGEVTEGSSSVVPTTSIAARTEPAGIIASSRDPIADKQPNLPPSDRGALTPTPQEPQPTQSASAKPAAHWVGPHRPPQHHQRVRPPAPGAAAQLVPW